MGYGIKMYHNGCFISTFSYKPDIDNNWYKVVSVESNPRKCIVVYALDYEIGRYFSKGV